MLELDAEHGDIHTRIADEEIKVMVDLTTAVLAHEDAIASSSELLGELDSLLALASVAEKYNWVPPRMTLANVIEITDGRHPLQELIVPAFNPNGCSIEGGSGEPDGEGKDEISHGHGVWDDVSSDISMGSDDPVEEVERDA